jgi:hypothetical protein
MDKFLSAKIADGMAGKNVAQNSHANSTAL